MSGDAAGHFPAALRFCVSSDLLHSLVTNRVMQRCRSYSLWSCHLSFVGSSNSLVAKTVPNLERSLVKAKQASSGYHFIIILCFKDHHYYCRNLCVFYHLSNMTYVSPLQLRRQQFGEGVRKQSVLNGFFILLSLPFTSMQSG